MELRAPGSKSSAWFCHILTRGPWLLECTFRVAKRSFDARKLNAELGLVTLDEREDLPIYGQWRRVKRRVRREFDDIRMHIHDLAEIDTPAFRRFLKTALDGYLETIGQWAEDPESAEPWKTDGRKWHTSQKAISPNRRKLWKPTLLMELIGRLNKCVPDLKLDWNHKTAVVLTHPAMDKAWGKIVTSSRYGLRVELRTDRGRFTPAKIERLGKARRHLVDHLHQLAGAVPHRQIVMISLNDISAHHAPSSTSCPPNRDSFASSNTAFNCRVSI